MKKIFIAGLFIFLTPICLSAQSGFFMPTIGIATGNNTVSPTVDLNCGFNLSNQFIYLGFGANQIFYDKLKPSIYGSLMACNSKSTKITPIFIFKGGYNMTAKSTKYPMTEGPFYSLQAGVRFPSKVRGKVVILIGGSLIPNAVTSSLYKKDSDGKFASLTVGIKL
jgi:hypothetical protein